MEGRTNKLKGGLSDNMTLTDLAKRHNVPLSLIQNQLKKGLKVEMEHTKDVDQACEIAMDHLFEISDYYDRLGEMEDSAENQEIETNEQTCGDSSGSFEGPISNTPIIKRKITSIPNTKELEISEITDASSSGSYDVPAFAGAGRSKNPLKIDGVKSINNSRAVKDKNFPKWGGPESVYVKIKDKCKKFPYCNQGDINAIEMMNEMEELKSAISYVSIKNGIPRKEVENIILNEIKKITI